MTDYYVIDEQALDTTLAETQKNGVSISGSKAMEAQLDNANRALVAVMEDDEARPAAIAELSSLMKQALEVAELNPNVLEEATRVLQDALGYSANIVDPNDTTNYSDSRGSDDINEDVGSGRSVSDDGVVLQPKSALDQAADVLRLINNEYRIIPGKSPISYKDFIPFSYHSRPVPGIYNDSADTIPQIREQHYKATALWTAAAIFVAVGIYLGVTFGLGTALQSEESWYASLYQEFHDVAAGVTLAGISLLVGIIVGVGNWLYNLKNGPDYDSQETLIVYARKENVEFGRFNKEGLYPSVKKPYEVAAAPFYVKAIVPLTPVKLFVGTSLLTAGVLAGVNVFLPNLFQFLADTTYAANFAAMGTVAGVSAGLVGLGMTGLHAAIVKAVDLAMSCYNSKKTTYGDTSTSGIFSKQSHYGSTTQNDKLQDTRSIVEGYYA